LLDHYAVQLVATTFGSRGCELRSVQHRVEHGGFASSGGDSVGAGDAFVAVLCQHLADTPEGPMHRDWLQTAAIEANRYGAFVASQVGAMSPLPLLGRTSVSGPEPG
jgi:sugar/nucleoside kinase (ribokinase family)